MAGRGLGQPGDSAVVSLDNLTVSYRQHPALHHVSGHFAAGSLTAILGPNGSGKSTLLKSIMGLLPLAGGTLTVAAPRERIAYLPQLSEIDRNFPLDVRDVVLMGCWPRTGAWREACHEPWQRADMALHSVGLQGFETRPIASLSSGQLQRVLFARLLVQDAQLILLDEPFHAMDSTSTQALLALMQQWHTEGRTVLAVLHDDAQVRAHFPQVLLLAREAVAWGAAAEVMRPQHWARARAMAEAWDESASPCAIDHAVLAAAPQPKARSAA